MATKKIGISHDLLVHPGETIADILNERNITRSDLAARCGISEAYLCNVIHGKKDISSKLAQSLEYALGVSKSFWLNLQAIYDTEKLELTECETINDNERQVEHQLGIIEKYLDKNGTISKNESVDQKVLSLRKILQISDLSNLDKVVSYSDTNNNTMPDYNPYVLGALLRLCKIENKYPSVESFQSFLV